MNRRKSNSRRPNVIWIFGDQHRGQALGCAGDPNLSTPNLDRFASEGAVRARSPAFGSAARPAGRC